MNIRIRYVSYDQKFIGVAKLSSMLASTARHIMRTKFRVSNVYLTDSSASWPVSTERLEGFYLFSIVEGNLYLTPFKNFDIITNVDRTFKLVTNYFGTFLSVPIELPVKTRILATEY